MSAWPKTLDGHRHFAQAPGVQLGAQVAGRYQKYGKPFGPRRIPVRLAATAA
jgi:hypothetical protein